MKKLILLIYMLTSSFATWADCAKPVTYLSQNDPAPCSGYLFTQEKELDVRIKVSAYDNLMKLNDKNNELIDILSKRVENQSQQNLLLQNEINQRNNNDYWQKTLFFILGSLVTITLTYTAIQIVK